MNRIASSASTPPTQVPGAGFLPLVLVAAILAVVMSFGLGAMMPRHSMLESDALWYWNVADDIATSGLVYAVEQPQPTVSGDGFAQRPPGHPVLLAAAFRVVGEAPRDRYLAALLLLSLLAGASTLLVARLALVVGLSRENAAYVALAHALAPTTVWLPRTLLSETTAAFLLLAYLVAAFRVRERPSLATVLGAGAIGGLCLHTRIDLGPVVVGIPVALMVQLAAQRSSASRRSGALSGLALVAVASVLLCIPWSAWLSRQVGHVVAVAEGPAPTGYSEFQTTLALRPEQYMRGYVDFEFGRVASALRDIPDAAWGRDRRHSQQLEILAETAEDANIPTAAIRDELRLIANERIAAAPFRYYVWLPMYRAWVLWVNYHQAQTEQEQRLDFTTPRTFVRTLWNLPFSLLVVVGAIRALILLLRPAHRLFPVAVVLVLRTATLVGLSTLSGYSHVLPRYLVPVYGIATLLAVVWLVDGLPAARSRNGEPARI